ncbi:MAG TPA: hypothetical protein VIU87_22425 [Mycobacterium sp.]
MTYLLVGWEVGGHGETHPRVAVGLEALSALLEYAQGVRTQHQMHWWVG